MQVQSIKLSKLKVNSGQIEGLPANPRLIKDHRYAKLLQSIQDDPEMLQLRELIVFPQGKDFVVIGGNMRLRAIQELKHKEAPCKILPADTTVEKLKAYTIKDNVSYGENDWEGLANDWNQEELAGWGMEVAQWNMAPSPKAGPGDEDMEGEPSTNSRKSSSDTSEIQVFELPMLAEHKMKLLEVLGEIKTVHDLATMELALMYMVNNYYK